MKDFTVYFTDRGSDHYKLSDKSLKEIIELVNSKEFRLFPDNFLTTADHEQEQHLIYPDKTWNTITEFIAIPQKALIIGDEFFGNYDILEPEGEMVLRTDSFVKAKYICYASRFRVSSLLIPISEEYLFKIVAAYENYYDKLLKELFKSIFQVIKNDNKTNEIVKDVLTYFNLTRYYG